MAKSKTSELIESMTIHDQKAFRNYLDSPFFNCDKVTKQLFELLLPEINRPESPRNEIYSALYPSQKFDDKVLRYAISDLNRHLIHYFTLKHFEKNPQLMQSAAVDALSKRDCEKAYQLLHQELTHSNVHQNAYWFYTQFEHAEKHLIYTANKLNRKSTPDYSTTLDYLDTFYLVKKLQLSCEVTNLANILKKQYKITLLDPVKKLATQKPYCTIPSIRIYFHILETLTNPAPDNHFRIVEGLLKEHRELFHPKELGEMYQYLKNYCVKKINQGESEYLRILFNLHCAILTNKSLMNYDYLSQWDFKNIVSISLRLNEKQWCDQFIHKYINYLRPEERKNALAYNQAYSWFMENDFHKAIRKLQEVEMNDVFYQLDSRVILLKSYFELDDQESFFYQASAFRLFLLRNRYISDYQKNIYRNLIKFLAAILRAGSGKVKLQKIKSEIEQAKNVADLTWLIKQLNTAMGE